MLKRLALLAFLLVAPFVVLGCSAQGATGTAPRDVQLVMTIAMFPDGGIDSDMQIAPGPLDATTCQEAGKKIGDSYWGGRGAKLIGVYCPVTQLELPTNAYAVKNTLIQPSDDPHQSITPEVIEKMLKELEKEDSI